MSAYRKIAQRLDEHLQPSGRAYFEIGKTQAYDIVQIFKDAGFASVSVHKDLNGHERIIAINH